MAGNEQDEKVPEPEPQSAKRTLDPSAMAVAAAEGGRLDVGALMAAAGGEVACRWRAAGASHRAWLTYQEAEEAYWDAQDVEYVTLRTAAILRMAETTLRNTTLTPEHREHGWSERLIDRLASMCAKFRAEVENGRFANPRAGHTLARNTMEEVSPKWPDLDELSVAVDLARRALDIASRRLGLGQDSSDA